MEGNMEGEGEKTEEIRKYAIEGDLEEKKRDGRKRRNEEE